MTEVAQPETTTIPEFLGKLHERKEKIVTTVLDDKSVKFQSDNNGDLLLEVNGVAQGYLTPATQKTVKNLFGIPDFAFKLKDDPDLRSNIFNYCLRRLDKQKSYNIKIANAEVVSIIPAAYPLLKTEDVFAEIDDLIKGFRISHCVIGPRTTADLVLLENSGAPAKDPNDRSVSGISVGANGSVDVGPFVWRLICTNGLRVREATVSQARGTTVRQMVDDLRKKTTEAVEFAKIEMLSKFLDSDKVVVQNPAGLLHHLARARGIPTRLESRLLSRLPSIPEHPTAYDLTNLVTEFGRDLVNEGRVDQGHRVGRFAYTFVPNSDKEHGRCSHCQSMLDI